MAEFCQGLSAKTVDGRLKQSLVALRLAEKNAVLWFAEVMQRKLYRDLGYSSIQQYAELELGFKRVRTSQFIRLSQALCELPKLMQSVARGEVSWTKAREVSGMATPKTEMAWIAEARKSTSRELERKVAITKQRARAVRSGADAQGRMMEVDRTSGTTGNTDSGSNDAGTAENVVRHDFEPPGEVPSDLHHRLSPTQYARYEALMEKLRKLGVQGSREDLLLECMEIAVEVKASNRSARTRELDDNAFPRGNSRSSKPDAENAASSGRDVRSSGSSIRSPYQVTVWMCEGCGTGTVETGPGARKLAPATLKAILCDAMVRKRGKRNRAAIPARVRRQVMERDRMRCRAAGCSRTRFLSVHHLHPKGVGGSHDLENLVTLCDGCHKAAHQHSGPPPLRRLSGDRDRVGDVVGDRVGVRVGYGVDDRLGDGVGDKVRKGAGAYTPELVGCGMGSSFGLEARGP